MSDSLASRARGLAPLAGVLLVLVTLGLAATVSGVVLAGGQFSAGGELPPRVSLALAVDGDTLTLTHRGGDELDVTALRIRVLVDGDPLAHQPPVPFFSARGFHSGPTGPFNSASDSRWTAGETTSLRVAGTNQPALDAWTVVSVRVYADDTLVADASARADG